MNNDVTTYFHGAPTTHEFINRPERDKFCDYLARQGWDYKRGSQDHYVFETH